MFKNKDHFKAYLRDRWAQHAHFRRQDARGARYAAQRRCVLSSTGSHSCRSRRDSLTQVSQSVIPEHYAPILVVPGNPSQSRQSESIRLQHRQSDSIRVNSSFLHIIKIIKIIFIFNSFTCTGRPDPIDQGRFKLASRNLVWLPISMPLIDTN